MAFNTARVSLLVVLLNVSRYVEVEHQYVFSFSALLIYNSKQKRKVTMGEGMSNIPKIGYVWPLTLSMYVMYYVRWVLVYTYLPRYKYCM